MIRTTSPRPAFGVRAKAPAARATSTPRAASVPVLGKLPALARLERLNAEARADALARAEWEGPAPAFRSLDGLAGRLELSRARKARDNRILSTIAGAVIIAAIAFLGTVSVAKAEAPAVDAPAVDAPAGYFELQLDRAADGALFILDSGLTIEDCAEALAEGVSSYYAPRSGGDVLTPVAPADRLSCVEVR